jgi:hypothetical protein
MNSWDKGSPRSGASAPTVERRRRKRIKMTAPVRVRTYGVTNDCFEEI